MSWYLRPNASSGGATSHVFIDTESQSESVPGLPRTEMHRLLFGHAIRVRLERGAVRSRQCLSFTTPQQLWAWLLPWVTPQRQVWLWGHRVGWDFLCVDGFKHLPEAGYVVKHPCLDDPPTIMHWWTGPKGSRKHIVVLDSMNWWRTSLAHIGKSVGLQKLAFPDTGGVSNELSEYCIRDAEILESAVLGLLRWVRGNDMGVLQKTAPAQALQVYRHKYGPRVRAVQELKGGKTRNSELVLPCVHHQKPVTELERSAYYGGECQIYYQGRVGPLRGSHRGNSESANIHDLFASTGPVYHLDHTGFYPSLMRGRGFPARLLGHFRGPTPDRLAEILETECAIAEVSLCASELTFPRRRDGKLSYPLGRYDTVLAGPELTVALRHGLIEGVGWVARYERAELFTKFVDAMWELRLRCLEKGDAVGAELTKLIMNGLYGKFGQRDTRWQDDSAGPPDLEWGYHCDWDHELERSLVYRGIAGSVQRLEREVDSIYTFPAIPAYVTSYGRERMRHLRELVGPQRYYYQHTDSLHVSELGYVLLEADGQLGDNQLGKLRLVERVETAEYRGLNDYTLGERVVVAGVKDPAHNESPDGYHVRASQRLTDAIRAQPLPGVLVKNLVVKRHNDQLVGRVGPDGWVDPVTIGLDPQSQGQE